jgi:hypothetical protein
VRPQWEVLDGLVLVAVIAIGVIVLVEILKLILY